MNIRRKAFSVALVVLTGIALAAQQVSRTQPTFKTETELVQVPAVVTGKNGDHVRGLTREAFRIFESGKEQKIAFFEEMEVKQGSPRHSQIGVFTNHESPDAPQHLTVFLLDLLNTNFVDQVYGRSELLDYLRRSTQGIQVDCLLTLTWRGVTVIHDFSTDPAVLVAALEAVKDKRRNLSSPGSVETTASSGVRSEISVGSDRSLSGEIERLELLGADATATGAEKGVGELEAFSRATLTVKVLTELARSLKGIPGRKSLVWLSSYGMALNNKSQVDVLSREMFNAMADAQISIYPVDSRGLANGELTLGFEQTPDSGPAFAENILQKQGAQFGLIANLKGMAADTGGLAFVNRNDLSSGFTAVEKDSSHYYMLGYYRSDRSGKRLRDRSTLWHPIEVKVSQAGTTIRARKGFFETLPAERNQRWEDDLQLAADSPLQFTAIPFEAKFNQLPADSSSDKRTIEYEIHIVSKYSFVNTADDNRTSLRLVAVAKDELGIVVDQSVEGYSKKVSLADLLDIQRAGGTFDGQLHLRPGEYTLRFVIRDDHNGAMGSIIAPLTVK